MSHFSHLPRHLSQRASDPLTGGRTRSHPAHDGGKLIFNGHTHEQFVDLFHDIGADPTTVW